MNLTNQIYIMRKRLKDEQLLKIQKIISEEIERRKLNDEQQVYKNA